MAAHTRWRLVEEPCSPGEAPARWHEAKARGAVGAVTCRGAGMGERPALRLYWEAGPDGALPPGEDLVEEDWTSTWRETLGVVRVGRFALAPVWEERLPDVPHLLRIDPGMAFGAGEHPTTRLCLKQLEALAASGVLPSSVLDVGAGTGVLSLAAAALGCRDAAALDIDPFCYAACRRNAALNGLASRVRPVLLSLDLVENRYPLVVANVVASQLEHLAGDLARATEPGGRLLLSGFQVGDEGRVRSLLAGAAVVEGRGEEDNWVALLARRPSRSDP